MKLSAQTTSWASWYMRLSLLATRITSVPSLAYHLRLSNLIAVPQLSEFYAYEDTFIYDDMVFEILKPYSHS